MGLTVGQKVAYPGQGVCLVEQMSSCKVANGTISGYTLRVLGDGSTIFVPQGKADNVGIRPIITQSQCKKLISILSRDFKDLSPDWKVRSREFMEKLQSGDVFEAADVLKKLTFLSCIKRLSFREQTMLEKAKFLIISELANADEPCATRIEDEITKLVDRACAKHRANQPDVESSAVH
jgi:CarD family transcriptional regulator